MSLSNLIPPKEGTLPQIDRWTTASSNCLGYAPEDGDLVKFDDHESEVNRLRNEFKSFISTVLTIKRINEPEWMEYLAERINEVCEVIGEEDRVVYNPRNEFIHITRKG